MSQQEHQDVAKLTARIAELELLCSEYEDILNGGGRRGFEHMWFWLREVECK